MSTVANRVQGLPTFSRETAMLMSARFEISVPGCATFVVNIQAHASKAWAIGVRPQRVSLARHRTPVQEERLEYTVGDPPRTLQEIAMDCLDRVFQELGPERVARWCAE